MIFCSDANKQNGDLTQVNNSGVQNLVKKWQTFSDLLLLKCTVIYIESLSIIYLDKVSVLLVVFA